MKKIFAFLTLFIALHISSAQAQHNVYAWSFGTLNVISNVDSITFTVGPGFYNIRCSSPNGITTHGAQFTVSVSSGDVKSGTNTPEIGVCYSEDNELPTTENYTQKLGSDLKVYSVDLGTCISGTKYYYRAYVKFYGETFYSNVNTFTTLGEKPTNVTVTINGHEFVDLGLPSGLLWAACNIGATKPWNYGDYFSWGETKPKRYYSLTYYKWLHDDINETYTKYNNQYIGYHFDLLTLDPEDDAATQNWGKEVRMPTKKEFEELINNTYHYETTVNGILCYKFTGINNPSAFIYLPASGYIIDHRYDVGDSGYYWSNTLTRKDGEAYALKINSPNGAAICDSDYKPMRNIGQPVRAVYHK